MAIIKLSGMDFKAFHGLYPEERQNGNRFTVDISFEADTTRAEVSDAIDDTIDYSALYSLVQIEMNQPSNLLEHIAARIKNAINAYKPGIANLQVAVTKHNPPVNGVVEKVTVVL